MGMPAMRHCWTSAEVRELIDESRHWPRYELLGGELVVTPAPGTPHQIAVTELLSRLMAYVDRHGIGVALVSPADLELLPGTISQPDVFVVPRPAHELAEPSRGWADVKSLLLAVEVISPGSVRTDRVEKRDHYMAAGVPEYWVVDIDARVVERWTPEREGPDVLRTVLEWHPAGESEALTIELAQLFDTIERKFRLLGSPRDRESSSR